MERYGLSESEALISLERRQVYGDPEVNHIGIAMGWAGILQPWALDIAAMRPLPPHVVALLMASLKLNRMRVRFHADNYDDASVYQGFARAWQREHEERHGVQTIIIPPRPSPEHELKLVWEKKA